MLIPSFSAAPYFFFGPFLRLFLVVNDKPKGPIAKKEGNKKHSLCRRTTKLGFLSSRNHSDTRVTCCEKSSACSERQPDAKPFIFCVIQYRLQFFHRYAEVRHYIVMDSERFQRVGLVFIC